MEGFPSLSGLWASFPSPDPNLRALTGGVEEVAQLPHEDLELVDKGVVVLAVAGGDLLEHLLCGNQVLGA